MNILVLGSGGREHTFAWKIAQSSRCGQLFVAPGNSGTDAIATNLNISVTDFEAIKEAVILNKIQLVIVGPEDPLVQGIHDFFLQDQALKNVAVIGPQQAAAELEGSKEFAKKFMMRHNIPTAAYASFIKANVEEGYAFLESLNAPYVLKADGLAAGKGVVILNNLDDAKAELKSMLVDSKFGDASAKVVIEEFLDGIELSCFVLTDGKDYKILPTAKDYKRIGEGDTGLNTGGMGAISPVPFATDKFLQRIENEVVKPTVEGLKKDNLPYVGFIFIGLIKVGDDPKVIEYNVRMGDPETQVVLPRIKSDFLDLMISTANESLSSCEMEILDDTYSNVVMVAGGYPEAYEKGNVITGIPENSEETIIFQAGTKTVNTNVVTNGGRVLSVVSKGTDHKRALSKSYEVVDKINYKDKNYRKDIGFDL